MPPLEKFYKTYQTELDPLLRKALEKNFNRKTIFFGGAGVFLGYPTGEKEFVTLTYSKAKLVKLLKESSITVKSSMSYKVNLLVWNGYSYYHNHEFDKYEETSSQINWETFLQPMVDCLYKQYRIYQKKGLI